MTNGDELEGIPAEEVEDHDQKEVRVSSILRRLPVFEDDFFLQMQATNLDVVDLYIRDLESDLLRKYIERERTPMPEAVLVSALSQLWVFGLYELLRTWRQRSTELLQEKDRFAKLAPEVAEEKLQEEEPDEDGTPPELELAIRFRSLRRVVDEGDYAPRIRVAVDASERLFRRLEALRMALAKHEIPRRRGSAAFAPGYGRIDMASGSMLWMVSLGGNQFDTVSRRAIVEALPSLLDDLTGSILPEAIQEEIKKYPAFAYGFKEVVVTLEDGRTFTGTIVAWNKQVVDVGGHEQIPFDARAVVGVEPVGAD